MRPRTLVFCVIHGIKNLFKNKLMSLASIATITASLFVVGIFYCTIMNLEYTLDDFQTNIGIAVFFHPDVTENEILTLKNQLTVRKEVAEVTYISGDEAWKNFKKEYFKEREDLLAGFENDNPLSQSASLQVLFRDISKQPNLIKLLNEQEIVRHVRDATEVGQMMSSINNLVTYIGAILIIILGLISLFIIGNTIRMAIAVRRREIVIMRYVGAKTIMIKGPFIIEGIIIGLIGAMIPLLMISYFYNGVVDNILVQFYILRQVLIFIPIQELIKTLTPVMLISGGVLGFIGSSVTVGRYIKV